MSDLRWIFRQTASIAGSRMVLFGLGLAMSILTVRLMGPDGRGTLATAANLSLLVTHIGSFGLPAAILWSIGRERLNFAPSILNALSLGLKLTVLALGLMAGLHVSALSLLGSPALDWLVVAWMPLGVLAMSVQQALIGIGRSWTAGLIDIMAKAGAVATLAGLWWAGLLRPETVFAGSLVWLALALILIWPTVRRLTGGKVRKSPSLWLEQRRYGWQSYVMTLVAFAAQKLDLVLVHRLLGATEAGYYAVAVNLVDVMMLPAMAVLPPLVARLSGMADDEERRRTTGKAARAIGAVLALAGLVLYLAADPIVHLLFGDRVSPAVPLLRIMVPGAVLFGVFLVWSQYLASYSRFQPLHLAWTLWLLVASAANVVLLPTYGGRAAAYAFVGAATLALAVMPVACRRPAPAAATEEATQP